MATDLGQVSNDIKIYMKLLTTNRYYALNDRTINLLLKGDIDMSAVEDAEGQKITESDAEVVAIIDHETEVEIFVVEKNKTRQGGAFFPYINNTIFDFDKYGIFLPFLAILSQYIRYIFSCLFEEFSFMNGTVLVLCMSLKMVSSGMLNSTSCDNINSIFWIPFSI